jgi:GAF domain-containing protein
MDAPVSVPSHPRISDSAARALVQAVMDAELLGVALVRGPTRVHAMVNAKYQALVGSTECPTLGQPIADVLPRERAPEALLVRVLAGHGPVVQREVRFGTPASGAARPRYVTLTYQAVDEPGESVLVLAEDVTDRVRERERAELFVALVAELLPASDARAVVRSIVARMRIALGATASSMFRVSADGATLQGSIGEWDWTRTSFSVPTRDWPTVEAALASGHARYITAVDARMGEAGWFETRGIASALCVPLRVDEQAVAVIFFDFEVVRLPELGALAFAENVATHCAAALQRAHEGGRAR